MGGLSLNLPLNSKQIDFDPKIVGKGPNLAKLSCFCLSLISFSQFFTFSSIMRPTYLRNKFDPQIKIKSTTDSYL